MHIEAKVPKGAVIRCDCNETFVVKQLGLSVECPYCGKTALSADMAADYALRDREEKRITA